MGNLLFRSAPKPPTAEEEQVQKLEEELRLAQQGGAAQQQALDLLNDEIRFQQQMAQLDAMGDGDDDVRDGDLAELGGDEDAEDLLIDADEMLELEAELDAMALGTAADDDAAVFALPAATAAAVAETAVAAASDANSAEPLVASATKYSLFGGTEAVAAPAVAS